MTLRIDDAQRFERDRTVTYSWRLGEPDADGWTAGVELSAGYVKAFRAMTVTALQVAYRDGMVRYYFSDGRGLTALRLDVHYIARYSAKALRDAEALAIANVGVVSDWALGVAA